MGYTIERKAEETIFPSREEIVKFYSEINAKDTNPVYIGTTQRDFVCTGIFMIPFFTKNVDTAPTVSIGTNGSSYTNIMVNTVTPKEEARIMSGNTQTHTTPMRSDIYANIPIAANADSYLLKVVIVGFYI